MSSDPQPNALADSSDPAELSELASSLRRGVLMTSRRLRAQRVGDLTEAQFSVLAHLAHHGETTPSDLAVCEAVSAPTMTRIIGCLGDAGFIERQPFPGDGRQVLVALTAAGREALESTRRRRDAWLATKLHDLPTDELATLGQAAEILRRISAE